MFKKGFFVAAAVCAAIGFSASSAGAAPAMTSLQIEDPALVKVEFTRSGGTYRLARAGGVRAGDACELAEYRAMTETCIIGERPVQGRTGSCDCTETAAGFVCEVEIQCLGKIPAE